MSDTVLKFIPTDPTFIPPAEAQQQAMEFLESLLPEGEDCQTQIFPRLEFIDQGENLERVFCPGCHATLYLDFFSEGDPVVEWWHSISDEGQERGYEGVRVSMPCCHRDVLFTDLTFDWPGGFARFQLDISNPQIGHPLPDEDLKKLSNVLGCHLKQIWAHY